MGLEEWDFSNFLKKIDGFKNIRQVENLLSNAYQSTLFVENVFSALFLDFFDEEYFKKALSFFKSHF